MTLEVFSYSMQTSCTRQPYEIVSPLTWVKRALCMKFSVAFMHLCYTDPIQSGTHRMPGKMLVAAAYAEGARGIRNNRFHARSSF